ncbi:ubiquinol-cytochrome C chaperone family protein [Pseudomonas sp. efr-133-TYG-103a]|uniref:ubiquinol-cytochrome C chaperone family protein n=1 Tax=Pseudomonas sp. efr-133-TYG-103a TaxID=3040308 RepID=UPI00255540B4|nr:ubiquinol-cytochrome C chaperone family protein [Pseudomonas sp. efr-133-TYG-103a]
MPIIHDPDLADVLMSASADDVGLLIDVITDNGKGRISLSSSVCRQLMSDKDKGVGESTRAIFAEELTRFGGNSLVNLFRGGSGVPYRELLADVAGHVGAKNEASANCAEMEMAIITKVFAQSLARMSEEDRKTLFESLGGLAYRPGMGPGALAALLASLGSSGLASYNVAAVVASATMSSLVGRGVVLAGSSTLGRGLAVLAGPVGWAITGIWTAFDLASPAYRVTVPCVIQIGHMRQKMLLKPTCPGCHAIVAVGANFCGKCGIRLGA